LFYQDGQILWGYSVPRDVEPFRWFKLLLLREEDLTAEVQQSEILLRGREMLKELDKAPTDLVADYLKGLWSHVLATMRKARSKSVVEALAFHVVVTVPAMWPDYARKSMTEALQKAGIFDGRPAGPTTLAFAPEPEAAALVTLWERAPELRKGDVFMICDAGGGTVVC
jgi:molecular chaperone DnaK (HSP70)